MALPDLCLFEWRLDFCLTERENPEELSECFSILKLTFGHMLKAFKSQVHVYKLRFPEVICWKQIKLMTDWLSGAYSWYSLVSIEDEKCTRGRSQDFRNAEDIHCNASSTTN